MLNKKSPMKGILKIRAENGTRTRDPQLGKLMLYRLSYFRIFNFTLMLYLPIAIGMRYFLVN
jgi:hypothetical protein